MWVGFGVIGSQQQPLRERHSVSLIPLNPQSTFCALTVPEQLDGGSKVSDLKLPLVCDVDPAGGDGGSSGANGVMEAALFVAS